MKNLVIVFETLLAEFKGVALLRSREAAKLVIYCLAYLVNFSFQKNKMLCTVRLVFFCSLPLWLPRSSGAAVGNACIGSLIQEISLVTI